MCTRVEKSRSTSGKGLRTPIVTVQPKEPLPQEGAGPLAGRGIYVYTLFSAPFGGKVVGLPTKGGSTGGMKHYVSLFALGDARS